MSRSPTDRAVNALTELGAALQDALDQAPRRMAADKLAVIDSNGRRLLQTFERLGSQLGVFIGQYERFQDPEPPPSGGKLHRGPWRRR